MEEEKVDEQNDNEKNTCEILLNAIADKLSDEERIDKFADNFVRAYTESPKDSYNDEFFFDILKPAISKLIHLRNDTAKELRYFEDVINEKSCVNEGTDYAKEIIEGIINSVDDILLDYDVQSFNTDNDVFDPRRQSVVKKVHTRDIGLEKTIAERLSCGYERNGKIIAKERVSVYVFEEKNKADNGGKE